MTADLEEVSHSISNVLARSSDILPEQVEVELQLTGETISTDGYVVFPAKDRLKAYQFEQMLQNRLEEIFKAGTHGYNLDVDSGLTLKVRRFFPVFVFPALRSTRTS